ncbi:unnamed protein product [Caenorhabditis brenneri]
MGTRCKEKEGKPIQEGINNQRNRTQDTQDEGSLHVEKTQLDELPEEEKEKKKTSEKSTRCVVWSQNMLKTAKISRMTQEYRDNKGYKPNLSTAISEKTMEKNRYHHIFCADENRVVLKGRDSSNDYINASWMEMPDGLQFISTQGPIKNTIADFWHMIYTEKCSVIVMLCQYVEDEQEKCQRYFSDSSEKEFGEYTVKVIEKAVEPWNPVKMTVIQLQKKNSSLKHLVHHYWYYDWHDQVAPLDPVPMIKLYKAVLKKSASKPIVVHCSAGVGRTSTFVGIHLGSVMIRESSSVEMVEILKRLRKMRLGSIQSQLQYVFLIVLIITLFIEDKIIKKDELFESLLNKYVGVTKKVTAAIMEEEEGKRLRRKEKEAKEKEKEAREKKDLKNLEMKTPKVQKEVPSRPVRRSPATVEDPPTKESPSNAANDNTFEERNGTKCLDQKLISPNGERQTKLERNRHKRMGRKGRKRN